MEYIQRNKSKSEQTAEPSKYPQKEFNSKPCRMCRKSFDPKAPSEHYCSDECKDRGGTDVYLKRTYGISVHDYEDMYVKQLGLCKICGDVGFLMDDKRHKLKLVVDHCHKTGQVRGLLCHNCNRGLGLFQDNTETLANAISYLKVQRLSERSTPEANAGGSAQPPSDNFLEEILLAMKTGDDEKRRQLVEGELTKYREFYKLG